VKSTIFERTIKQDSQHREELIPFGRVTEGPFQEGAAFIRIMKSSDFAPIEMGRNNKVIYFPRGSQECRCWGVNWEDISPNNFTAFSTIIWNFLLWE